jgi:type III restriction enzyme
MKTLKYQLRAVRDLVEKIITLLENPEYEQNLVFKAPTGSGKTIMATQVLSDLTDELASRPNCTYQQVAFVWIAPQKLHLQSFEKLKAAYAETRKLTPVLFDDIDQSEGYIKPGEILFVNWESVNKDSNLMVREQEAADSFFDIIDRTQREQHRPVVLIVDEEHRNWSKTADKSLAVVRRIHPKVELRISATPKTQSYHAVVIQRKDVIAEEMIKRGILLNEDIDVEGEGTNLNLHLLDKAVKMRNRIAEAYQQEGVSINPLLLIQLPNDTSEALSSEERTLAESLEQTLRVRYDITEDNGLLGTWLSGKKTIGDEITRNDDLTQVLLFKQAIALGWDCPRAAVLLIFRNLQAEEFTVQTLGRILRMPEQRFYSQEVLNVGHVYTDISREKIRIAIEDSNYISKDTLRSERREGLRNIKLESYHRERRSQDQNRLGMGFRKVLLDEFATLLRMSAQSPTLFTIAEMENWEPADADETKLLGTTVQFKRDRAAQVGINLDVKHINVVIPRNVFFQNDEGEVVTAEKGKFARTEGEVHRLFMAFCRRMLMAGGFEPKSCTEKLAACLYEMMEELFGVFENETPKIILSNDNQHHNRPKFEALISRALDKYAQQRQDRLKQARERAFAVTTWQVPAERYYRMDTHHTVDDARNHALLPFVEQNKVRDPEIEFAAFLERNTDYIDWWYKNGDEGMMNYSIPYVNIDNERSLFYVDFVVRMKNGNVFLFDTKTEGSDKNATRKHNALLDYMEQQRAKGLQLDGGIIIGQDDLWRYSAFKIENTNNTAGWQGFFPDQYA